MNYPLGKQAKYTQKRASGLLADADNTTYEDVQYDDVRLKICEMICQHILITLKTTPLALNDLAP